MTAVAGEGMRCSSATRAAWTGRPEELDVIPGCRLFDGIRNMVSPAPVVENNHSQYASGKTGYSEADNDRPWHIKRVAE